jgi:hypothetical protein
LRTGAAMQSMKVSRSVDLVYGKSYKKITPVLTLIGFMLLFWPLHASGAAAATQTSLTITSAGQAVTTVAGGNAVVLSATVTSGGNAVTRGTINFCYSAAKACSGAAIAGTAQITAAGSANFSFRPAAGSHSYTAVFAGTSNYAGSSSSPATLTVTPATSGTAASATVLTASGYDSMVYSLIANVVSDSSTVPTGNVSFVDLTARNTVLGSAPVTGSSQAFTFFPAPATTDFTSGTPLVSGDFNGDGITDLIDAVSSGTIVLLGNGDGSFHQVTAQPGQALPAASTAVAGDFNSDGNLDLALATGGSIQIFLGDGTGNFAAAVATLADGPVSMQVADFNKDGNLDIASTDQAATHFYWGAGDGTFTTGPVVSFTGGDFANPEVSAVGDFDSDGNMDLAVGATVFDFGMTTTFPVTFFLGDGTGNFRSVVVTPPAGADGNYGTTSPDGAQPEAMLILANDVNGDGRTDISVFYSFAACCPGTQNSGGAAILNNGDGTFATAGAYDNLDTGNPIGVAVLDSKGDGTSTVSVRYDQPVLGPLEPEEPPPPAISSAYGYLVLPAGAGAGFVAGDFNGDGKTDIALGGPTATSIAGSLNGGTATLSNIVLSPKGTGTHQIQATYAGDATHLTSTSSQLPLFSGYATPTLVLTGPSSVIVGSPVTVSAAISSTGFTPSGAVYFFTNNGQTQVFGEINKGVATGTFTNLAAGTYSIIASFVGDQFNNQVESNMITVAVTLPPATINLTTTTPAITYGGAVTLSAAIPTQGAVAATGSITFKHLTTVVGTQALNANGVATLTLPTTTLPAGADAISASYAGDKNYGAATSTPVTITVSKEGPAITLTASSPTINLGASETFTVSLPSTATGTVMFKLGSSTLGSNTIANGVATLTTATLAAGHDSVTAIYSGDGNFNTSTSTAVAVAVAPMISLTSAVNIIYSGTTDTVSIAIGTGGNSSVPSGTIVLSSGSFTSASTALTAGSATITIPANALPAGNDLVTATYSGDANYPAATGTLTLVVSSDPPPGFTLSAPTVSLAPGATTGNTVQITLMPVTGFTGTVSLTAKITASPANATDLPTFSFGSTNPATITGSGPVTATLTISTTPMMTSKGELRPASGNPWWPASATMTVACLLWVVPTRKHRRALAKFRRLLPVLALLALCIGAASACGGKSSPPVVTTNPGTTPGAYSITVTGTSGSVTTSSIVTLTVQ